jgi:hypothetical protein
MNKFVIGQMIYLPQKKKYGIITALAENGKPSKVDIGGKIVDVLFLVIKIVPIFKQLWLIIKGIFRKK